MSFCFNFVKTPTSVFFLKHPLLKICSRGYVYVYVSFMEPDLIITQNRLGVAPRPRTG